MTLASVVCICSIPNFSISLSLRGMVSTISIECHPSPTLILMFNLIKVVKLILEALSFYFKWGQRLKS